jgi:WD40 repeat protein
MTKCNVNSVALNQDNSMMLVGCDGVIQAWDMKKGRIMISWTAFNSPITSLAFSADNTRIAAGSYSGFIKVWDLGE